MVTPSIDSKELKQALMDSFLEDKFLNLFTSKDSRLEYLLSKVISFLETREIVVKEGVSYEADIDEERTVTLYLPPNPDLKIVKGILLHEFFHVFLGHFSLVKDFRINPYIANVGFDIFINSLIKAIDPKGVLWELPPTAIFEEDFEFLKHPVYQFYNEVELCLLITQIAEKDENFRKELLKVIKENEHEYLLIRDKKVKIQIPPRGSEEIGRREILGNEDLISKIKELKNVNWDSIFVKRIYEQEITFLQKRNLRREKKNRIYLKHYQSNIFIPSLKKEKERYVFFVVDTSSSMSEDSLESAKELIISLIKTKPEWKVIEVHHSFLYQGAFLYDRTGVWEVDLKGNKITKIKKIPKKEAIVTIKGRGGTSHLEVFEVLYPFRNKGEFIFVTDGMSDLETSLKKFPFFRNALFFAPDVSGVYYLKKAGIPSVYYLDSHTVRYAV